MIFHKYRALIDKTGSQVFAGLEEKDKVIICKLKIRALSDTNTGSTDQNLQPQEEENLIHLIDGIQAKIELALGVLPRTKCLYESFIELGNLKDQVKKQLLTKVSSDYITEENEGIFELGTGNKVVVHNDETKINEGS